MPVDYQILNLLGVFCVNDPYSEIILIKVIGQASLQNQMIPLWYKKAPSQPHPSFGSCESAFSDNCTGMYRCP
jgi:hypothetical protein